MSEKDQQILHSDYVDKFKIYKDHKMACCLCNQMEWFG